MRNHTDDVLSFSSSDSFILRNDAVNREKIPSNAEALGKHRTIAVGEH